MTALRKGISEGDKKQLCEWFKDELSKTGKRPHWQRAQAWFSSTHDGRVLSQSSISTIVSKRSADLLDGPIELEQSNKKKRRNVAWPELDDALYEWAKKMERRVTISGLVLKEKAAEIFSVIYPGETLPIFSDGWLDRWKKKHKFKEYKEHGESGSATNALTLGLGQMNTIRDLLRQYNLDDVYNFDETGYYYRMQPDRRLCTEQLDGTAKDKLRITVGFTSNGTGTDKLPLWVIGKSQDPRCFKNINRESLRIVYRNNATAWMKNDIMVDYLRWFDRKMRGRQVILLMDNFSAHELAVAMLGGETALQNTRIAWLPANTTSVWQPLDQGIIQCWKSHTRKYYVRNMVRDAEKLEVGQILPKITLLQAVRWAVEAWNHDVKPSTIYNCFRKSTGKFYKPSYLSPTIALSIIHANPDLQFPPEFGLSPLIVDTFLDAVMVEEHEQERIRDLDFSAARGEVERGLNVLEQGGFIQPNIDLDFYLNPSDECVEDGAVFTDESFIAALTQTAIDASSVNGDSPQNEVEEPEKPKAIVSSKEVIKHLEAVELYFLQQEESDQSSITAIMRIKRLVEAKRIASMGKQAQTNLIDHGGFRKIVRDS